jgi:nucleoside-diphosphate-sugar epimerase
MKKVLITARKSYIGNAFAKWTKDEFENDLISCRSNDWSEEDFSKYDSILHVAGIAHVSTSPDMEDKYFQVNRDLTLKLAQKAKSNGVKQFIFLSSIIVYGNCINEKEVININTIPEPQNFYGLSKLQAEEGLKKLESEFFKVVIIRPPMIYGKNSKGNYPKLAKLAKVSPIFPDYDNKRSMLHIDNLCEFLKLMVINEEHGMFFPQNKEYVKTTDMVKNIAQAHGKEIKLVKVLNFILNPLVGRLNIVNKIFGNLIYDKNISLYKENYQLRNLKESIEVTEK